MMEVPNPVKKAKPFNYEIREIRERDRSPVNLVNTVILSKKNLFNRESRQLRELEPLAKLLSELLQESIQDSVVRISQCSGLKSVMRLFILNPES
jgi:CRISPR/Cas system CSM-associated protein Csm2 small subunit